MPAETELCVDPLAHHTQVELFETANLAARKRLVGEVGERRSAPQRERLAQQQRRALGVAGSLCSSPFLEPLPEAVDVELARRNAEGVASCLRLQTVVAQDAAQLRHVVLEDLRRRRRRLVGPELVDQRVGRQRLIRMDQQKCEQRSLLAAPDRELSPVATDLERTEDAEIHLT